MKAFWRIITIISIALWIGGAVWILMQYDRTYKRVGLHRTEIYKMWNIEIDDYYSQSLADEIIDCCKNSESIRFVSDYRIFYIRNTNEANTSSYLQWVKNLIHDKHLSISSIAADEAVLFATLELGDNEKFVRGKDLINCFCNYTEGESLVKFISNDEWYKKFADDLQRAEVSDFLLHARAAGERLFGK